MAHRFHCARHKVRAMNEPHLENRTTNETTVLSVIVPCFNAAATLGRCLDALLEQEGSASTAQILVIDNNSTDATASIAAKYSGVELLRESTQGAYAARNAGLRQAKGEIMAFIDPDCIPRPDWLAKLTQPFDAPSLKIAIGRSLLVGDSLAMRTLQDYEHIKDASVLGGTDPELYYGHTNNMAIRREVFDVLGPFAERRRGGDVICVRKCVDRWGCEAVEYQPDSEVMHLEMDGLRTYFRKVLTYGWSNALYSQVIPSRVAPAASRWALFRKVCDHYGYTLPRQLLLLGLMAVEGQAWQRGYRRGCAAGATEPTT